MLFKRVTIRNIFIKYSFLFCTICLINCSYYLFKGASKNPTTSSFSSPLPSSPPLLPNDVSSSFSSRHLLSIRNCTPPAIDQFPKDLFTLEVRREGAIALHIVAAIYMFFGLALACDEYFVPACERFCNALGMSDDVAGATFMAAGSSAPELATAIIGVFVAKDDIGLGSVIGSAVFNIMLVVSLCALFAGMVVELKWWPMCRDCVIYLLSIFVLVLVIMDELVYWYEALCMLVLYILYIVLMFYNSKLEKIATTFVQRRFKSYKQFKPLVDEGDDDKYSDKKTESNNNLSENESGGEKVTYKKKKTESINSEEQISIMLKSLETNIKKTEGKNKRNAINDYDESAIFTNLTTSDEEDADDTTSFGLTNGKSNFKDNGLSLNEDGEDDDEEFTSVWEFPENNFKKIFWILCLPLTTLMFISVPDCRNPRLKKLFAVTFLMSCVWIAVFSYVMVWMITVVGYTFGVPDSVMGLTLIAAGSSVPDAIASLIVVRAGQGDMAVSNAIGSNIFDIFVCLGVPWLIQTTIHRPFSSVTVYSSGLIYTAITLLGTVFVLLILTHFNNWRLTKPYGVVLLLFYIFFNVFASLFELNVFGFLNPPDCLSIYDL